MIYNMLICLKFEFFGHSLRSHWEVISRKFAHKFAKSKYLKKFKINRNVLKIPLKMMYNMSMLPHQFSNERWWGGGGAHPEPPSSLKFCKSAYFHQSDFPKKTIPLTNFHLFPFHRWKHQSIKTSVQAKCVITLNIKFIWIKKIVSTACPCCTCTPLGN